MKFSIITLMTMISIFAWCMTLYNTADGYRGTFVAISLLVVVGVMFGIAMSSPKDENGAIDPERNIVFQAFEPTFKTVGIVCAAAIVILLLGLVICVIWLLVLFALHP